MTNQIDVRTNTIFCSLQLSFDRLMISLLRVGLLFFYRKRPSNRIIQKPLINFALFEGFSTFQLKMVLTTEKVGYTPEHYLMNSLTLRAV